MVIHGLIIALFASGCVIYLVVNGRDEERNGIGGNHGNVHQQNVAKLTIGVRRI